MFSKIALYPLIKSIFAQHQSCRSLKVEQLSCWALFHLSFSLKVIAILQLGPWNFWKLKISPDSSTSCSHWPPTRRARAAAALLPLALSFLALPRT